MIHQMTGNLFLIDADIRVNTVNCVGVMGKGIALEYKKRYPAMFEDYAHVCRHQILRPGLLHLYNADCGMTIVNFPTKDHWANPSQIKWIDWGLRQLNLYLRSRPGTRVSIPALGCSNGGLAWRDVKPLIFNRLGGLDNNTITVFEPQ